jgi:DNA-binding transcriptional LysR family regulator
MNKSLTGRLYIGCGSQQSSFLIPSLLPILMEKFSNVQFKFFENNWDTLEERLIAGRLDAILYGRKSTQPNLEHIVLSEDEIVLFAPFSFQPANLTLRADRAYPCVDMHVHNSLPFVLINRVHQLRAVQDRIILENRLEPNIILETDNWLTCLRMVESGIAFSILPNLTIDLDTQRIKRFSFKKEYIRQTILCYRKNAFLPKILQAFISVAYEVLRHE